MKWISSVLILMGCGFRAGAFMEPPDAACILDGDAGSCSAIAPDGAIDGTVRPPDAAFDAPLDAFACMNHSQCIMMDSSTCCVNPGPTGYCTHGIVIGGVCQPQ